MRAIAAERLRDLGYAGDALKSQLAPGTAVIGKPFTLDALAARVRAILEGARVA